MEKKVKKRVITNVKNLTSVQLELVRAKYPSGYWDFIKKFEKPNGEFFYYFTIDDEDTSFLVKVDVKVDNKSKDEDEKDYYGEEEDIVPGADNLADQPDESSYDEYDED